LRRNLSWDAPESGRYAHHLRALGREFRPPVAKTTGFDGAARRIVPGVEIKHQGAAGEIRQGPHFAVGIGKGKSGALAPTSIIERPPYMSNSYIICRVLTFSLFNITLFGLAVSIRGNSTIKNAIETQFLMYRGLFQSTKGTPARNPPGSTLKSQHKNRQKPGNCRRSTSIIKRLHRIGRTPTRQVEFIQLP
jgi:hypothetical protein